MKGGTVAGEPTPFPAIRQKPCLKPAEKKTPGCQLIPSDEIFGIRRNSNAKAYDFSPLYSYDTGSLTHFDMLAMCGTAASQQPDGDIYDGCSYADRPKGVATYLTRNSEVCRPLIHLWRV